MAHVLIMDHGNNVVEAVLRDTLFGQTRKSSKMRWNNFQVFARNWKRNHEEYLASATANHQTPQTKFEVLYYNTNDHAIRDYNEMVTWLKANGKLGDWSLLREELEEFEAQGVQRNHMTAAIRYLKSNYLRVNKDIFIHLLLECAGVQPKPAAAAAPSGAASRTRTRNRVLVS